MIEALKLVWFPMLIGVGWLCSRLSPEFCRVLARVVAAIAAAALVNQLVSGCLRSNVGTGAVIGEVHRWTGHVLVIVL